MDETEQTVKHPFTPTAYALAGVLARAVAKDETTDGCDISAGLYGKEASQLLTAVAWLLDEYAEPNQLKNVLHHFQTC